MFAPVDLVTSPAGEVVEVEMRREHPRRRLFARGAVVVGLVDGYTGTARVWHGERTEVFDSVHST